MSKRIDEATTEFEHPVTEHESSSGRGWLLTILLLGIVGIVIWFVVTHESS